MIQFVIYHKFFFSSSCVWKVAIFLFFVCFQRLAVVQVDFGEVGAPHISWSACIVREFTNKKTPA